MNLLCTRPILRRRVHQSALLYAFVAMLLLPIGAAHAQDTSIAISAIRAIRISDSSVSLSFLTKEPTIGSVEYTSADDTAYTLTDSAPQSDHLFTIDSLDPLHPYSFRLTASSGDKGSNTYVVLISPSNIGATGQSIVPNTQEVRPDGTVVASMISASTTPAAHNKLSPWLFVVFALVALIVMISNRLFDRARERSHPTQP